MREKRARRIAFLTGLLVLFLAIAFAVMQNPVQFPDAIANREQAPPVERQESLVLDPERIEAGLQVYKQQSCARCHSIAGIGNPRIPLDDVGARRTAEELSDWIIGAEALQGELPERVFKLKQAYRELSGEDHDALVIYMQSLRPEINRTM
jgi:mono/diheme cytochrome c family protein